MSVFPTAMDLTGQQLGVKPNQFVLCRQQRQVRTESSARQQSLHLTVVQGGGCPGTVQIHNRLERESNDEDVSTTPALLAATPSGLGPDIVQLQTRMSFQQPNQLQQKTIHRKNNNSSSMVKGT